MGMTRIGKVYPKNWETFVFVRRQHVCENGKWIDAVFERKDYIDMDFKENRWVRVK
jgi:hypothetical protein